MDHNNLSLSNMDTRESKTIVRVAHAFLEVGNQVKGIDLIL